MHHSKVKMKNKKTNPGQVELDVMASLGHHLHCGACMTDFETMAELNKHLETCSAARSLLFPLYKLLFAGDSMGHPLGSLIYLIHKNVHLIRRYAYCIASELNSLERAKIHYELCEKLGFDYKTFKPFESEKITSIPTPEEAEAILWEALGDELRNL
jgi:hypothetical protein